MKTSSDTEILYRCPKNIVTVIRKRRVKRYPVHDYPCVLLILHPKDGTRVQKTQDGGIEYMPAYDEFKEALIGIDPKFARILPPFMKNKPIERQRLHDRKNAKRRGSR